jgi:hypothetical protein
LSSKPEFAKTSSVTEAQPSSADNVQSTGTESNTSDFVLVLESDDDNTNNTSSLSNSNSSSSTTSSISADPTVSISFTESTQYSESSETVLKESVKVNVSSETDRVTESPNTPLAPSNPNSVEFLDTRDNNESVIVNASNNISKATPHEGTEETDTFAASTDTIVDSSFTTQITIQEEVLAPSTTDISSSPSSTVPEHTLESSTIMSTPQVESPIPDTPKNNTTQDSKETTATSTSTPISQEQKPTPTPPQSPPPSIKDAFNYASFDCGSLILSTSENTQNPTSILFTSKDTYMLQDCATNPRFVVVELCERVLVSGIQIANLEWFSCVFREFRVWVRERWPAVARGNEAGGSSGSAENDGWLSLGIYSGMNVRSMQVKYIY